MVPTGNLAKSGPFGVVPWRKLVMKWRDAGRIADRIVEIARGRAQKGSAFLPPSETVEAKADEPTLPLEGSKE